MSSIDEIKESYKVKFDANNPKEDPGLINITNFGKLLLHMNRYKFEKRIEDINLIIKGGKIKDTKLIDECTKQINEIKNSLNDILKKFKEDEDLSDHILFYMQRNYDYYLNRPEALDTYQRIGNSLLEENVAKFIKYEKIFIVYNEKLNDINKQLNINN